MLSSLRRLRTSAATRARFGFTLVELLIVVLIVGILAAVAVPIYLGVQDGARKSVLAEDVRQTNQNITIAILEGATTAAQVVATAGTGYISNSDPQYATITVGGSANAYAVGAVEKKDSVSNDSALSTAGSFSTQLADAPVSANYYAISGFLTNGYTYSYDQYKNVYVNNGTTVAASGTTSSSSSSAANVAPSITSAAPTSTATTGSAYTYNVVASGTPSTISYTATGLPTGLSIASATGLISGTPTTANTYSYTITASNGTSPDATQSGSIVVSDPATLATGPSIPTSYSSGTVNSTSVTTGTWDDSPVIDSSGNVYYTNSSTSIVKMDSSGTVTNFVGVSGTSATTDGTGTAAKFARIQDMITDTNGNIYVSDYHTSNTTTSIRKITPAGVVTTLNYNLGSMAYPHIAFGPDGSLYATNNNSGTSQTIIKAPLGGGTATTVYNGTGTNIQAQSIWVGSDGTVYFTAPGTPTGVTGITSAPLVYKVTGTTSLAALGTGNGYGLGVRGDSSNNLFVGGYNSSNKLYEVNSSTGAVTVIAETEQALLQAQLPLTRNLATPTMRH